MFVPAQLQAALESLPSDDRIELAGGWAAASERRRALKFRAKLTAAPTTDMPEWSAWYLVLSGSEVDPDIRIYPDANEGITATFPHQEFNGEPIDGVPWRSGKPCLERPTAVFRKKGWSGEPSDIAERISWHIGRLLDWIDAAATNTLLEDGDALELPHLPPRDATMVLGFRETPIDLSFWAERNLAWGFATISAVPAAQNTAVVADFMDSRRRSLRKNTWTKAIPVHTSRVDAVWIALPGLLVFPPWRAPTTWAELAELCHQASVDLPQILADAGARLRRIQRPKHAAPVQLLLGFPFAERVGSPPERFHWLCISNMRLCSRDDVRRGYPGTAAARRRWDMDLAASRRPLEWQRTVNWAPDQLRKRGEAEENVRSRSILLIGIGTLGAAIAENLLRMGATKMALLDDDRMQIGNLSRHLLTMSDAGHQKAVRMAERLNAAAPDASVTALPFSFPPTKAADIAKLRGWDVIVDCSASDAVLHAMAAFPWMTERLFVSLAMTWEAKGLFVYSASEASFPAIDAVTRFAAVAPLPADGPQGVMEGIGCWHPVFPATADDVNLWAAIGSKFIRRFIVSRQKMGALYLQKPDGSVEIRSV